MSQNERGSRANGTPKNSNIFLKDKPCDGFAWQRYARDQTISAEVAHKHKTDPQTAKFLLVLLSTYAGKDGTADPGQKALMRQIGCGERTLRRATAALEASGLLAVERKRQGIDRRTGKPRTNLYAIVFRGPATVVADGHTGHDSGRSYAGHSDGRSGIGHGDRERSQQHEGPAIERGGTGHSEQGDRPPRDRQTKEDERSSERFSRTSAHAREATAGGIDNGPSRSLAPAGEGEADNNGNGNSSGAPEPSSEGPATAMTMADIEPWEGYDGDGVSDVIAAINYAVREYDETDLTDLLVHVWAFESAHDSREAIIERVEAAARVLADLPEAVAA